MGHYGICFGKSNVPVACSHSATLLKLALLPGFLHLQLLVTCSMQEWGKKAQVKTGGGKGIGTVLAKT